MPRESTKALIREIEKKRNSKVIAYITSDRQNLQHGISADAVSVLHEHILAIDPQERSKLDLFLYSRGGESDTPWTIVSMFRECSKEGMFSVLIPYRAHSAATVIALGADEIIMTEKAELGPIDITIERGPYNPTEGSTPQRLPISVEDVTGYFALLAKIGCKNPEEKLKGFEQLTNKVHPLALGTVSRLLEQTKSVALKLLGTRAKPFTVRRNKDIIKKLSSEIYSHRHTICRTEAIKLGLEQVIKAEDAQINNELWGLYNEYRSLFSFEEPFTPEEHLISNNLDQHAWQNLGLACIESVARKDSYRMDLEVRRARQIPPQVNLNLNNLAFPPLNIGNLPQGTTPQQVAQMVEQLLPSVIQPIINKAANDAVAAFLNALPTVGFEHIGLNKVWKKES